MTTKLHLEHPVEADQRPTGEEMVHHHALDMLFSDLVFAPTYFVTDSWYFTASAPLRAANTKVEFLDADRNAIPGQSSIHHRNETLVGMGDISLITGYRVLSGSVEPWNYSVDLGIGSTLPTGSTEPDPFELGRDGKDHQHIMFGSGTYDPTFQLNALLSDGAHTFSLWSTALTPLVANNYGMKSGAEMSAGLGWLHSFGLDEWLFQFQPELYHEEPTSWSGGETSQNTGRTDFIAGLGATWLFSETAETTLMIKKPFNIRSAGGQLEMPLIISLGLNLRFDLGDED